MAVVRKCNRNPSIFWGSYVEEKILGDYKMEGIKTRINKKAENKIDGFK